MREIIDRILNEYIPAKNETFAGHPIGTFFRTDIPQALYNSGIVDSKNYLVTGSVGQGNWAMIPWVCIFDRSITTTATKGVYIVYLLEKTGNSLYLTFNQGCTEIRQSHTKRETIRIMREKANEITAKIDSRGFRTDEEINLGSGLTELGQLYQKGTIFYKEYKKGNVPDEAELKDDLSKMMDIYKEYVSENSSSDHKSWLLTWNPVNYEFSEYENSRDLVLSGEKFIQEWACANTHVKIGDRVYLMRIGAGNKNGIIASGYAASESYLAPHYNPERAAAGEKVPKIDIDFDCFLDRNGLDFLYQSDLKIMFPSQNWSPQGSGIQIKQEYVVPLETEWQKYAGADIENDSSVQHQIGHFDSWEIVDENTAIKTCDKSFFEYNGSGVPKGICWFFDAENLDLGERRDIALVFNGINYSAHIINESTDRRRVRIFWESNLGDKFKALRKDETQKLEFIKNGDSYSISFVGGRIDLTTKEAIAVIKEYISSRGFSYPDGLIENFYLCLKSKPFVILAGTSGTGKTRLVKLFAEAIGAAYFLVPVRPDWSDGSDLFGHYDLSGRFMEGPICAAFEAAEKNPDRPVLLCLDEMNLARVEYYLSDFLAVIESREKRPDGSIITDGIAQYADGIPSNIYIVGTVNMDETTFPFSKKVLDRANTIEFNYVDLAPEFDAAIPDTKPIQVRNEKLRAEYLVLVRDCAVDAEYVQGICDELNEINEILFKANAHVGYRVRDEIVFYMLNNRNAENLLTEEEAFDNEILQKILPRIQGSSEAIKAMLVDLFKYCKGDQSGIEAESGHAGRDMQNLADTAKYPKSAKKIGFMMTRFEEDGFTSYWL